MRRREFIMLLGSAANRLMPSLTAGPGKDEGAAIGGVESGLAGTNALNQRIADARLQTVPRSFGVAPKFMRTLSDAGRTTGRAGRVAFSSHNKAPGLLDVFVGKHGIAVEPYPPPTV